MERKKIINFDNLFEIRNRKKIENNLLFKYPTGEIRIQSFAIKGWTYNHRNIPTFNEKKMYIVIRGKCVLWVSVRRPFISGWNT